MTTGVTTPSWPSGKNELEQDLDTVEQFLHEFLDDHQAVGFDNEGCEGHVEITLGEEPVLSIEVRTPVWTPTFSESKPLDIPPLDRLAISMDQRKRRDTVNYKR